MIHPSLDYPDEPAEAEGDAGADAGTLRYDDVVQDGRLRIESAWRPTGKILWGNEGASRVLASMEKGTTNVLSRTVLEGSDARLVPRSPVETRVRYRFEHTVDGAGEIERLLFSTWLVSSARQKDGSLAVAGRAYGQRVFTKIHAKPGEHLVKRLDGFGPAGVPPHRATWEPVTSLLEIPRGAEPLEPAPRLDPNRVIFGLSHTDLNQHVNFLMYHRVVEQAALGRFVDLGLGARLVSRHVAFGYRKPSFAGDTVKIALRAFRLDEGFVGVVAAIVEADGGASERGTFREFGGPRCVARLVFRP